MSDAHSTTEPTNEELLVEEIDTIYRDAQTKAAAAFARFAKSSGGKLTWGGFLPSSLPEVIRVVMRHGSKALSHPVRFESPRLVSNAPPTPPPARSWEETQRLERHWTVTPEEYAAHIAAQRAHDGR